MGGTSRWTRCLLPCRRSVSGRIWRFTVDCREELSPNKPSTYISGGDVCRSKKVETRDSTKEETKRLVGQVATCKVGRVGRCWAGGLGDGGALGKPPCGLSPYILALTIRCLNSRYPGTQAPPPQGYSTWVGVVGTHKPRQA